MIPFLTNYWALKINYSVVLLCAVLTSPLCAANGLVTNIQNSADTFPDWVATPGAKTLCQGYYQPALAGRISKEYFSQLPVSLYADETELHLDGTSHLKGNVVLEQGNRYLHADTVSLTRDANTQDWQQIRAFGNIHYFSPGLNIWAHSAKYCHPERYFELEGTFYRWYEKHARGQAQHLSINHQGIIKLRETTYTTCAPHQTTWELKAKDIELDTHKGYATAKHIWLTMKEIPVFYFPYFTYPIDHQRHSGFLFPSYGSSSNFGSEILVPYYWNMAPNYDMTLAARWLSERGTEAQSKFRYLFAHSAGIFQIHFLPDDRKYQEFREENLQNSPGNLSPLDPRIVALHAGDNRTAVNYRHSTQFGKQWQANIIFDYVSDDNYFVDLGNDIQTNSTIHLPQQANLSYYGDHWSHYFNIEEYQVLQPLSKPINDEIYKRQPQWVFEAYYPNLFLNMTMGVNGETVNFTHAPDFFTHASSTTGQRYHLRPQLALPMHNTWYYLKPRIQLDWLVYSLRLGENETSTNPPAHVSRTIPLYDLDSGLIFEREFMCRKNLMIQTLEPRLYYLYVPYRDQSSYPNFDSGIMNFSYSQLFRDNRFSGRDRVGDTNQMSASLTSRLLHKTSGQEWLRASIGQIFYFAPRRVSVCEEFGVQTACFIEDDPNATAHRSNLVTEINLHANPIWSGGVYWEWDGTRHQTDQAAANIQYHPAPEKIIIGNATTLLKPMSTPVPPAAFIKLKSLCYGPCICTGKYSPAGIMT